MVFAKVFSVVGTLFLLSANAFASSSSTSLGYYVTINFNDSQLGKPVAHVMAHTGVVVQSIRFYPRETTTRWDDVRDIQMVKRGDHFFGKTFLRSESGGDGGGQYGPLGVAIQYWVTYQDGSTQILDTILQQPETRIFDGSGEKIKELEPQFDRLKDSSKTSVTEVSPYQGHHK